MKCTFNYLACFSNLFLIPTVSLKICGRKKTYSGKNFTFSFPIDMYIAEQRFTQPLSVYYQYIVYRMSIQNVSNCFSLTNLVIINMAVSIQLTINRIAIILKLLTN